MSGMYFLHAGLKSNEECWLNSRILATIDAERAPVTANDQEKKAIWEWIAGPGNKS